MDHVELKPYPFPEGVTIPRLMPYQDRAFNGDGYLAAEVLRLKAAHGLECAIETGTCLGSTALWLSEHFNGVWTFEINEQYHAIADKRIGGRNNIFPLLMDSVRGLRHTLQADHAPPLFRAPFLLWADAHWQNHCPLLDELEAIAKAGVKPCIVIHDMMVYGKDFGYDKMPDGRPFSLELVAPYMNRIYGAGMWRHRTPEQTEGANRGWLSTWPASAAETMEPTEP